MDADYQFFIDNLSTLYAKYGRKALAIKDKRVLGAYDSIQAALIATVKTEKLGTFIVEACAPTKEELYSAFVESV